MNVLSLFDGMSCGQIALNRAEISYDKYYAAEVDKHAIKVTQANYPETIQMGDVTKWRDWDIDWSSIGLIMGGSPCQGFSFAGKQLAFDDPRSALFFTFVDILNHVKSVNPDVKFLLENVRMKKEFLDVISEKLGVEPVFINSALVSAQNRQRYYWANWKFGAPDDQEIVLASVLENKAAEEFYASTYLMENWNGSSKFLTSGYKSQDKKIIDGNKWCNLSAGSNDGFLKSKEGYRRITPVECERLQTAPDNYTNHTSKTQRYRMLGNGWTVDVIAHIFKGLKQ